MKYLFIKTIKQWLYENFNNWKWIEKIEKMENPEYTNNTIKTDAIKQTIIKGFPNTYMKDVVVLKKWKKKQNKCRQSCQSMT